MSGCKNGSASQRKPNAMQAFFDGVASSWDLLEETSPEDLSRFLDVLDIKEGDKILDIACGTGLISPFLLKMAKIPVLGIDLSPKMIEIAQRKNKENPLLRFECLDFLDLKEGGFDWAVCFNAYPHFLDPEAFAKKTAEILKPGGSFAILHNINRRSMNRFHEGSAMEKISRQLSNPEEEAIPFRKYFDILIAKEEEKSYLIIGRKKLS